MTLHRRQLICFASGALGLWGLSACRQGLSTSAPAPVVTPRPSPAPSGLAGVPQGEARIIVISDLNSQYGATTYEPEVERAIKLIPQWKPDLVLCGGDMIAGQKRSLTVAQIQAMWAAFDHHIGAPLRAAQIPLGFTIGNHDGSGAVFQGDLTFAQERRLAQAHWQNPRHAPGLDFLDQAHFPFYYSFTLKDIFFLVWDASAAQIPPEVLRWTETSLQSAAAQQAKLKIAIGHLPLYAVAKGRDSAGNYLNNADALRRLLETYQVHTYVSGHHHAYYPGAKGKLELLHAGALGGGPRQLLQSALPPRKTLTLLDVDFNPLEIRDTTYDLKTLKPVDLTALPPQITAPNGTVTRRDLWRKNSPTPK
ncbi:MAG: metallophosphoesterase [Cyanobacteria bacterium RI_101]|nr:metallophosphoesterase [Cyanobacteria bacterium RI_101]